jgi:glycosyltransferase involved in cell wall biosynthesis
MYLHKLILKSYGVVSILIAPSKFLAQKIKDWKIPASKIRQLYYFIDWENIAPSTDAGEDLIYIGRLSKEKGILTLLAAMKDLKDINLKIIGEGPQKKTILNYIRKNKLENVKLYGYKTKKELLDLVRKSRLVIVPSIWYDNNPVVILESFAAARPVIGSNLGGIPELVKDKQTGFIFQAGDSKDLAQKISNVYNNDQLILQMGKNCRNWVEKNCSSQKHLQEILKIYNEVLK